MIYCKYITISYYKFIMDKRLTKAAARSFRD